MKLVGISGTVTGSKTAVIIRKVDFCDGRDPSMYTGDTKPVILCRLD